ncbi:angiopoietin 4 isoform X1 [Xenopus tropicalis]|uniref:Angiopoietin 4 n=1 Tax=Xenopus tropicalis TaxID=8364 RepID=A0A803K3H1_XENTR|nr:angiopoietin 4 isoform X1 [Xenopus tropicalis]
MTKEMNFLLLNQIGCLLLLGFHVQYVIAQVDLSQNAQGYDCSHIWERNNDSISGIYTIKPLGAIASFQVFCEMKADGGWTLIQRHDGQDGLLFNRVWADYKIGFGNISGEHWLGLDQMYMLTNQDGRTSKLLISLGTFEGNEAFSLYSSFRVGPQSNLYQLSVGEYSGSAGDAFRVGNSNQDGSYFSTKDKDNDKCISCKIGDTRFASCSRYQSSSGWWFGSCGNANLNGQWRPEENNVGWASSVYWGTYRIVESLKYSKMFVGNYPSI